ncbi:MAG: hypothetical protein AAF664_15430 [Planctomycetota bacterium]
MPRDAFLIRMDPKVLNALKRWAEDEMRSTNGQIEYLLRSALRDAGRLPGRADGKEETKDAK